MPLPLSATTAAGRSAPHRLLPVFGTLLLAFCAAAPARADLRPTELRCEYKVNPLAVESARPRLFWKLTGTGRGERQTAFQIQVARSGQALARGQGGVWDTGKVTSNETIHIPYGGDGLRSGEQVFWQVRVWDAKGKPSPWSKPASWTMGLLSASDWKAEWIGGADAANTASLSGAKWIWHAADGPNPPAGKRYLRGTFNLPADVRFTSARLALTADNRYAFAINGKARQTGPTTTDSWRQYQVYDVARDLRPGPNTLVIEAENLEAGPAGVLARLDVTFGGQTVTLATGDTWESAANPNGPWSGARTVGEYGAQPWGTLNGGARTPPPLFRKGFAVRKPIRRALLYATALGVYELSLNGKPVSDDVLSPGWSDFRKRVHYNAYDVTGQIKPGANALGATLGDGWYASYLAYTGKHHFYGGEPKIRLQLRLDYGDGTTETVGTDGSWKTASGPITYADLLMGCRQDTRCEMPGWNMAGYNDGAWKTVLVGGAPNLVCDAHAGEPIRPTAALVARKRTSPKSGTYVYDFGQNLVGYVRLRVNGKPGEVLTIRHGERLNPDGTLYTTNLRSAQATDTYILRGGPQVLEPRFTFHGFQYAEISGVASAPDAPDVTGIVFHSDMPLTLAFDSDNPLLNRLVQNIDWGFRGNALDVPTDCPQRDERAGWMGDAQVFAKTSMFHRDAASFYTKWLQDVDDGQLPNGAYTDVSPAFQGGGNAAWEDATVVCAYRMYEMYGDTEIARRYWPSLTRYMAHLKAVSPNNYRPAGAYGDWLLLAGPQHSDIHGTAYYYRCADLMATLASAIGKPDEAKQYRTLADQIKTAFVTRFVSPDGKVVDNGRESQTFYALALDWDLLPNGKSGQAAAHLRRMLRERGDHLATGFIGTPQLLNALARADQAPLANKLLLTETFPSWLYQVKIGATTMWERWDGYTPERGFQDAGMNSFNHYWLGCVGEWMYTGVAGIDTVEPGWSKIVIRPRVAGSLNRARCRHDSIRGRIVSQWSKEKDGALLLTVTVPANVTATVYVPSPDAAKVTESGKPLAQADGVSQVRQEAGATVLQVGSGTYRFRVEGG